MSIFERLIGDYIFGHKKLRKQISELEERRRKIERHWEIERRAEECGYQSLEECIGDIDELNGLLPVALRGIYVPPSMLSSALALFQDSSEGIQEYLEALTNYTELRIANDLKSKDPLYDEKYGSDLERMKKGHGVRAVAERIVYEQLRRQLR